MSNCVYYSYAAQLYSWVMLIPWLVPFFVIAASFAKNNGIKNKNWGKQVVLVMFGLWLTFMQIILYILQYGLNIEKSNPYCPDIKSLVYPSSETFYTFSIITYIFCFTYVNNIIMPWGYWVFVFLTIVLEPYILFWFLYNDWYQTLVAILFGIVSTISFFVIYIYLIYPKLPVLLLQAPLTWFYAIDSHTMTQDQHYMSEYIQITIQENI